MFNQSGVTKTSFVNVHQILANIELQYSVGCVVPQSMGVTVDSKKIVKAGTPVNVNLNSTTTAVTAANGTTTAMNAVLLHDVDVTAGNANGAALIFGFVNLNRLETDVKALVTTALMNASASKQITFVTL
jgi:hypothetical protein